jgi:hypothetical protein
MKAYLATAKASASADGTKGSGAPVARHEFFKSVRQGLDRSAT